MTKLEILNPKEYGIEETKAKELLGGLPQIIAEREVLESQYQAIIKEDIENPETSKKARQLRLLIKENRTKGINNWHKVTKDYFLKGGQFVDAIKRKEIAVNESMELKLEQIEKYAELQEQKRLDAIGKQRTSELEPYAEFVPFGIDLRTMSDDDYIKFLNGAKLQHQAKLEAERKAEEERKKEAQRQRLIKENRETLLPWSQWIEDFNSIDFEKVEVEKVLNFAKKSKSDYDAEQEKIRKENERLRKEAEEKEEKKEKQILQRQKLAADFLLKQGFEKSLDHGGMFRLHVETKQKSIETLIASYRYDRLYFESDLSLETFKNSVISEVKSKKMEAELKAKKEAEVKAEAERKAKELADKKEAERLAKAPIKEKLSVWVNAFSLPETTVNNEVSKEIKAKFEAFKKWSLTQVENL